jgi:hypothetical protein
MNLATGILINEGIITKFKTNRVLCNTIKEIGLSTLKEGVLIESSPNTVEIFPKREEEELTKAPEKVRFCDTPNRSAKLNARKDNTEFQL